MRYELQVHALSPLRPTLAEVLARASESGIAVAVGGLHDGGSGGRAPGEDGSTWSTLCLAAQAQPLATFTVAVSEGHDDVVSALREAREAGEDVPDHALAAQALYVVVGDVDLDAPDESAVAAFMVTAWALASLTEGLVFDPQEEFFADAESFWALLADEDAADEALGSDDGEDDSDDDGAEGAPQDEGRIA